MTAPDTSEQNRLVECMNQSLINTATAMLIESGLPKFFWSDMMVTTTTVIGRTPASGLKGKVPYKVIFKCKVDISWLWLFGLTTYVLISKDKCEGKFASKACKAVLIGYTTRKKAYKLLDLKMRKEFSSCHVHFDETPCLTTEILESKKQTVLASECKWEPNMLQPTSESRPASQPWINLR